MAEGRVHLDCRNASNPYHECVEFCFRKIAESKERMEQPESDVKQGRTTDGPARPDYPNQAEDHRVQESGREGHDNGDDDDDDHPVEENLEVDNSQLIGWQKRLFELNLKMEENLEVDNSQLIGWQKRLFELNLKMNEARKAYQAAMVAEKKISEAPTESRGISKQKWIDERTNKNGKLLDANGPDMKKMCMLDTQKAAEKKDKKWEEKPAPFGRDGREEHDNGDGLYGVMADGRVHLDCRNASNPCHECVEFCFRTIAESKGRMEQPESDVKQGRTTDGPASPDYPNQAEDHRVQESDREGHDNGDDDDDDDHPVEENLEVDNSQLTGWRKRLFELNLKTNEARKAYQAAMVAEKKISEAPTESRGISKQKWIDERTNKNGKLLDANGPDMKKMCMLDTQKAAEKKDKKWEKKPAPFGRDDVKQGRTTDSPASLDYPYQAEDQHVQESGREEHGNGDELYSIMTDVKQGRTTDSPASSDYPYQAEDQHVQESGREEHGNGDEPYSVMTDVKQGRTTDSPASSDYPYQAEDQHVQESGREEHGNGDELYGLMTDGRVHLDCRNVSNPYHECVEFCFLKIAESKERMEQAESVSGQKTLYDAHKKRTKNIECNVGEYIEMKEADPEFYREASGLQYEKEPEISEDGFYKMLKEHHDKDEQRKAFSRRKFHEEKDIDSINNDRNENSNKILEIAFGKYTLEIKNNLERGTALQGCVGAGLFTLCISVAALNCIWVSIR